MNDPIKPSFLIPSDGSAIHVTALETDAVLVDQGYTYNQAGLTYNEVGVTYGGLDEMNQDIAPMPMVISDTPLILSAVNTLTLSLMEKGPIPSIDSISDIYTTSSLSNNQSVVGPGFWLYVGQ